jgi:CRISPR-associated protein Cas5t
MEVIKVVAQGPVTSFRYPHFVQGVHPTFEMPPPATIYGHICSAVGDYFPPDATRFAYHFDYDAKFMDFEHLHFFGSKPKMNPFNRELLFNPRLTLYVDNLDLLPYFQSPTYVVTLGRSQDLMSYVSVEVVTLEHRDTTFYSGTLIPLRQAASIGGNSYAVTMPRFIDAQRVPRWGQYAIVRTPILYPQADETLAFEGESIEILVDPQPDARHPARKDLQRGIIWHEWIGDDDPF